MQGVSTAQPLLETATEPHGDSRDQGTSLVHMDLPAASASELEALGKLLPTV